MNEREEFTITFLANYLQVVYTYRSVVCCFSFQTHIVYCYYCYQIVLVLVSNHPMFVTEHAAPAWSLEVGICGGSSVVRPARWR